MSRRVALGKLGTDSGTAKYGLRVSRLTTDAVPAASTSATVSIDDLVFDSLNPVGHFPIYRIYDVTVEAATARTDTVYNASGTPASFAHTEGSYTGTYGETLSYVPMPYLCKLDGSTMISDLYWKFKGWDWAAANYFSLSPDRGGWADVTKTGFVVYNLFLTETTYRLFLLDVSIT